MEYDFDAQNKWAARRNNFIRSKAFPNSFKKGIDGIMFYTKSPNVITELTLGQLVIANCWPRL